jgi:RHS repeat-associated protein
MYDAFGNVSSSTGAFVGPFGYGGGFGYQEDATGLKLLGHRLYDSSTGRFLTRDPIQDGRNWYVYCENDPANGADPEGLQQIDSIRAYATNLWRTYKDPRTIVNELDELINSGFARKGQEKVAQGARRIFQKMVKDWDDIQRAAENARRGIAGPGLRGGRRFENLTGKLPKKGQYREWDVKPPTKGGRGPERIVTDQHGNAWYSPNHYRDFYKL